MLPLFFFHPGPRTIITLLVPLTAVSKPLQFTNPEGIEDDCFQVIRETLQVEQDKRPTSSQLQDFAFLLGPKEKLVLQHCEFKIEERVKSPAKWLEEFKDELKGVNVIVQEKKSDSVQGVDDEEDVDATVRTVEADEDEMRGHMGMRSISVHVLRCVHETQNVVFKVTVTMMSPDAGQQNPYPIVAFDLQVGTPILLDILSALSPFSPTLCPFFSLFAHLHPHHPHFYPSFPNHQAGGFGFLPNLPPTLPHLPTAHPRFD